MTDPDELQLNFKSFENPRRPNYMRQRPSGWIEFRYSDGRKAAMIYGATVEEVVKATGHTGKWTPSK